VTHGRRLVLLVGGPVYRTSGGTEVPRGVHGQSPGTRSGGLYPPEAEAHIAFLQLKWASS